MDDKLPIKAASNLTDFDLHRLWSEAVKDRPDIVPSEIRQLIGECRRWRAMSAQAPGMEAMRKAASLTVRSLLQRALDERVPWSVRRGAIETAIAALQAAERGKANG